MSWRYDAGAANDGDSYGEIFDDEEEDDDHCNDDDEYDDNAAAADVVVDYDNDDTDGDGSDDDVDDSLAHMAWLSERLSSLKSIDNNKIRFGTSRFLHDL